MYLDFKLNIFSEHIPRLNSTEVYLCLKQKLFKLNKMFASFCRCGSFLCTILVTCTEPVEGLIKKKKTHRMAEDQDIPCFKIED